MKLHEIKWINEFKQANGYFDDVWSKVPESDQHIFCAKNSGLELYELYLPPRSQKYVNYEVLETTLSVKKVGIYDFVSCSICNSICREPMIVKHCAHRFCAQCIQRWLRLGNKSCPECDVKIPSRRFLHKDNVLETIINCLFKQFVVDSYNDQSRKGNSLIDEGNDETDSDDLNEAELSLSDYCSDDYVDEDLLKPLNSRSVYRQKKSMREEAIEDPLLNLNTNEDDFYEVFLVCLNHNLPPAMCSMARELSKRPLKLSRKATTYDAAIILAKKLIRDVLGNGDIYYIIENLSFVRDGDMHPAASVTPLIEVSRNLTEGKGPNVIRYLLSEPLFTLCERADNLY